MGMNSVPKPQILENGRWIIERNQHFVQWCAWREWLHQECGRTFFPDKLVVWDEWPPEFPALASRVLDHIAATRQDVGYGLPICAGRHAWQRWDGQFRADLARMHDEDAMWVPALPASHVGGVRKPYLSPEQHRLKDATDYAVEMMPQRLPGESKIEYRERILTRRSGVNAAAHGVKPNV